VFSIIVLLGLLSSVITAVIASLLLIEIVSLLPMGKINKIRITVISCFSIGLGAVLTPIGEPLSTIVVSKLGQNFMYMFNLLGVYMFVGIIFLGIVGTFFADNRWRERYKESMHLIFIPERETGKLIVARGIKIFVFVVALELLGFGFKPLIDTYVIHWSNSMLYVANTVSSILDNATLAAAEISPTMVPFQIKVILVSLLVSGGMLVTGNIPNIICASKMKISMKQWAIFGLPLGAVMLAGYYLALFVFKLV
jgi:predicted cation transporter